jgi:hypothetical protein
VVLKWTIHDVHPASGHRGRSFVGLVGDLVRGDGGVAVALARDPAVQRVDRGRTRVGVGCLGELVFTVVGVVCAKLCGRVRG